jgi:hypothetical protein
MLVRRVLALSPSSEIRTYRLQGSSIEYSLSHLVLKNEHMAMMLVRPVPTMHNARIYFLFVIFYYQILPILCVYFAGRVPRRRDAIRVLPPVKYHDTRTPSEYLYKSEALPRHHPSAYTGRGRHNNSPPARLCTPPDGNDPRGLHYNSLAARPCKPRDGNDPRGLHNISSILWFFDP